MTPKLRFPEYQGIWTSTSLSTIATLKSGYAQLSKNEMPTYEMISGAAIALAALLLIIPGFATDVIGFLIIFPITRRLIFIKFNNKLRSNKGKYEEKKDFIDGEFEDIENDDDRKI